MAVVTGAGSGIGRAVTRGLISAGYLVVLAGRRLDALEGTLSEGQSASGSFAVTTDVTDPDSVHRLFSLARERAGRVDLLVNNAGRFGVSAAVQEYPLADWSQTIAANLTGSFLCARAAFAQMLTQQPQGGRIVNNGSLSAQVPRPHAIAYTAAKHGITGLTKALALEGRAHGIACGQIDIGNAASELTAGLAAGALQPDGRTVAEPMMSLAPVAQAILYMASLPLDANVLSLTVMATGMPFVGRG